MPLPPRAATQPRPIAPRPGADGGGDGKAQLDNTITSALLGGLRGLRNREGESEQNNLADRQLQGWLSTFRGMRVRRQAGIAQETGDAKADRLPPSAPDLTVGQMLKSRFVLERLVAQGGMGQVFRAVDRRRLEAGDPQPYVALKVVSSQFRQHPDALRALEAEAHKVQTLSHPNICPIFDFDRDGPHAFFVMEMLEGETLQAALHRSEGHPLPQEVRQPVVAGLFSAMAHAHLSGIVHGDLKPANIFLCREGITKVLDFGVATALRGKGFNPTGLNAFTPVYSSPELMEGAPRDPRDDVYSMGCLLYLVYAGVHPFARRPALEAARMGLVPKPIPGMPEHAWGAIRSALSFDRAQRPADAKALATAILASLAGRRRSD